MQPTLNRVSKVYPGGRIPLGPPTPGGRKSVLIVGGGIAGLTVAYELSRSGQFDITVCEQNPELGGKARSLRTAQQQPTEHAMRVLLASYTCLFHIMAEIKQPDGTSLMDNLRYPDFSFRDGANKCQMPAEYTGFFHYIRDAIGMTRFFLRSKVPVGEMMIFLFRVGRLLWSTPSQVSARLGRISFEEYMDSADRSPAFRGTLLRVSEMLVAAKRTASAALVARLVLEWFVGPFLRSPFKRRGFASLDGPTSERLIYPWVEHLQRQGVKFRLNTRITALKEEAREITGVVTDRNEVLSADFYCVCLPHLGLDALIRGRLQRFVPAISDLTRFGEEWSAGIQYYLSEVPQNLRATQGRIIVDVASAWSIVYMLHAEGAPWVEVPLPPGTVAVLSLVMSNGRNSGQHTTTKPFVRCLPEEMKNEALAQIGLLNELKGVPFAIGPDLQFIPLPTYLADMQKYESGGASKINDSTILVSDGLLYVRLPQNLDHEPANFTDVHNFFIAGEFTRTNFSIPTMEKSCESGMRCASALCEANGLPYDDARLEPATLPLAFLRTAWFHVLCPIVAVALIAVAGWLVFR
jgi:uncharacterized protein with NAD-binding domain and iron-sulfur cluster